MQGAKSFMNVSICLSAYYIACTLHQHVSMVMAHKNYQHPIPELTHRLKHSVKIIADVAIIGSVATGKPRVCSPQRRVNFEKELADIPGERVAAQEDQRLQSAIAGLEMQLDYKRLDLTATQAKLDKMAADIKILTQVR